MTFHEREVADLTPAQRKHYDQCIANGTSPRMALMFASRQAALMGGSDQAFGEGQRRKMSGIPEVNRQKMLAIAQKAGINTNGKFHVSALGAYNNPLAWCSTIEDAKKSGQMQNLNLTGLVKQKAVEMPPPAPVALASDIVDDEVSRRLTLPEHSRVHTLKPAQRASALAEMREQIVAERGRPRRKSGRGGSYGRAVLESVAGSRAQ